MKTPPFFIGVTLMFWAWQTKLFMFAAIIAVVLEGSRFVTFRWDFSLSDFKRAADLCSIILIGMLFYLFVSQSLMDITFMLLQWLPVVFFPLLAAQCYSTNGTVDIRVLFLTLRRKGGVIKKRAPIAINLSYPYVILCILAAGAANSRKTNQFYLGLFLLAAWALWSVRSKRYSPLVWGSVFLIASIIGYVGHIQLSQLQLSLEQSKTLLRLFGGIPQDADPYQSSTALGDIGTVKLSNQAVFRVKSDRGYLPPLLLREASYNTYKRSKWFATRSQFTAIQPETDGTTWNIQSFNPAFPPNAVDVRNFPTDGKDHGYFFSLYTWSFPSVGNHSSQLQSIAEGSVANKRVTVSSYLRDGKGMLKLPTRTLQIQDLPVLIVESNQYGALKVEEGPGLITYQTVFGQHGTVDGPPDEYDFSVPPDELPVIQQLIEELELTSAASGEEILHKVSGFFQQNFSYSLKLRRQSQNTPAVSDFLLHVRSGHCEYFATATVLLLRAAGVPARYAAGYSVDGLDKAGKWRVVRGRHAHAWTLAYINGVWQDFDTTPPSWQQIENDAASPFEGLSDFWSRGRFAFAEWWQEERKGEITRYLIWLLGPLLLALAWKLYSKKRIKRVIKDKEATAEINWRHPGSDSEFYLIEKRLQESGFVRYPWESLSRWIQRIEEHSASLSLQPLEPILALHYRYRFDPVGLSADEKERLKSQVQSWLKQREKEDLRQ